MAGLGMGIFFPMGGLDPLNESDPTVRDTANAAMQAAASQKSDIMVLREQVERMALLNQSLWELMRERLQLTDADLEKIAQEVDLRDGRLDGRLSEHPLQCPKCGRVSSSRHRKCLYCGLLFEGDAFG